MKRAIGYLRVSGLGQVDKDGEQRQYDSIKAYCTLHNLAYVEQRFEKGVSGTVEGLDRPAFCEVLDLIKEQDRIWDETYGNPHEEFATAPTKAEHRPCIVVERMDRLARDLMVQELLLRECRERGIEVYAADQGLVDVSSDSGDPSRKLFRQIMGALAEWEKSALVLKLRKARDRKRLVTGRCEGLQPFHSTASGQAVLARINELRVRGCGIHYIVEDLNASGYKTCNGGEWTKRAALHLVQKSKGQRK